MNAGTIIRRAESVDWLESPEGEAALRDPSARESVYRALHPRAPVAATPLLRRLLDLEIGYRKTDSARSGNEPDYFENLYWCALLLCGLGDPSDALPLWNAKQTNMDTGAGLDIQFLVGAGVDATVEHLLSLGSPPASDAAEEIRACEAAGDFEELESWRAGREAYFDDPGDS
ncbi:unnamed protein product [Discosporangium mesarthrocarpum]